MLRRRLVNRAILSAGAMFAASACMTTGPQVVSVTSDPAEALVRIDGFGECTTPCNVEVDKPRDAVVAKAGFLAQDIVLTPDRRKMHIILELAAPTEGVESDTLPEVE